MSDEDEECEVEQRHFFRLAVDDVRDLDWLLIRHRQADKMKTIKSEVLNTLPHVPKGPVSQRSHRGLKPGTRIAGRLRNPYWTCIKESRNTLDAISNARHSADPPKHSQVIGSSFDIFKIHCPKSFSICVWKLSNVLLSLNPDWSKTGCHTFDWPQPVYLRD